MPFECLPRNFVPCLAVLVFLVSSASQASTLKNPTGRTYEDEVVRLKEPAPGPAGSFVVKQDGVELPYQVEEIDGERYIWVCSTS